MPRIRHYVGLALQQPLDLDQPTLKQNLALTLETQNSPHDTLASTEPPIGP
jgi:ABC-type methionine transport system ATPase subunit